MTDLFGTYKQYVSPKIRNIANAEVDVNAVRAENAAALRITSLNILSKTPSYEDRSRHEFVNSVSDLLLKTGKSSIDAARGTFSSPSNSVEVNVYITLVNDHDIKALKSPFKHVSLVVHDQRGRSVIATVQMSQIPILAADDNVAYITLGDTVAHPNVSLGVASTTLTSTPSLPANVSPITSGKHSVLVGIIDVGGFDFDHAEFVAGGETKFVRIWDQGNQQGTHPKGFEFGHEITQVQMNDAINEAPTLGVSPHDLERQSQQSRHSHGTHVASIAAGKAAGLAKTFDVAGVIIDLPDSDADPRLSFYDSTRIANAVDYLFELGKSEGYAAVSINISLGTNGHAHDGSAPVCRWIDAALTEPGRSIAVSAGNAGQQAPEFEGDTGYVMGRIHTSGQVQSAGLEKLIEWQVVGDGKADVSENELEIWYAPQDRFAVQLQTPDGQWLDVIEPGHYVENRLLKDGTLYSIYNEMYHEDNGHNTLSIYLSPFLGEIVIGIAPGTWTVRLIGRDIRDGHYHAWIERDDPRPIRRGGDRSLWQFPSFFSRESNVDNTSINTLACTNNAIGVGNLDVAKNKVNITSSQGPTRDGRVKPDVCAPGTDIRAANGFDDNEPFIEMSGTSMASPFVAGVVALMLSHEPKLTAAQICGILRRTAQPLPDSTYEWNNGAGFGQICVHECIREAKLIRKRVDMYP